MKRLLLNLSILFLAGLIGLYFYLDSTDFFRIDDCSDSGGSWHYDIRECSHTENYTGPRPS